MSVIKILAGIFTAVETPVDVVIPRNSQEVAIRIETNPPADINPEINIVVLDPETPVSPTYVRTFLLNVDGTPVPLNFKKYIGTIPFGPTKIQCHLIEVLAIMPPVAEHPGHPEHPIALPPVAEPKY